MSYPETKKFTDGRTDVKEYNIIRPFFKREYKKEQPYRNYLGQSILERNNASKECRLSSKLQTNAHFNVLREMLSYIQLPKKENFKNYFLIYNIWQINIG